MKVLDDMDIKITVKASYTEIKDGDDPPDSCACGGDRHEEQFVDFSNNGFIEKCECWCHG